MSTLLALFMSCALHQDELTTLLKQLKGESLPCEADTFAKLAKSGDSAVAACAARLKDADIGDSERRNLVHAMGHVGTERAIKELGAIIEKAQAWQDRAYAYDALGHIDRREVRKKLLACLESEPKGYAQGEVGLALARLKERSAIPALLKIVTSGDLSAYLKALQALELMGDAATGTSLAKLHAECKASAPDRCDNIAASAARLGAKEMESELRKSLEKFPGSMVAGAYFLETGAIEGAKPFLVYLENPDRYSAWSTYELFKEYVPDLPEAKPLGSKPIEYQLRPEDAKAVSEWFEKNKARLVFDKSKKVLRLKE